MSQGPTLPTPSEPVGTAGIFTVDYRQFTGVYTFLEDGRFSGVHFVLGELVGHPRGTLSESNSTTSLEPIGWANFVDDTEKVGRQEGGEFGRTFTEGLLSVKISGSMGTFSTGTRQQRPYSMTDARSLYHAPLAMSDVAGTYEGYLRTVGLGEPLTRLSDFALAEDGSFTTSAGACTYAGTLRQHAATGVFEAEVTPEGGQCRFTAPLAGLVTPTRIEEQGPTFAFQLDSVNGAHTAVFVVTRQ